MKRWARTVGTVGIVVVLATAATQGFARAAAGARAGRGPAWQTAVADLLEAARSVDPVASVLQSQAREHTKPFDILRSAQTLARVLHALGQDAADLSANLSGGLTAATAARGDFLAECAAYKKFRVDGQGGGPTATVVADQSAVLRTALYNQTMAAVPRLQAAHQNLDDLTAGVYEAGIDTNALVASAKAYKAYKDVRLVVQIIGEHNVTHLLGQVTIRAARLDDPIDAADTQLDSDEAAGYAVRGVTGIGNVYSPVPPACP